MPHFAAHLVDRAREIRPEDECHEFPTPLAYLLYQIVDTTRSWISDAKDLTCPDDVLLPDQHEGNHIHISFEAAEAIGRVLHAILTSPRVANRQKVEFLRMALACLRDLEQHAHLARLATSMREFLINPFGFKPDIDYLYIMKEFFNYQDHILRFELESFSDALEVARESVL